MNIDDGTLCQIDNKEGHKQVTWKVPLDSSKELTIGYFKDVLAPSFTIPS